MEKEYIVCLSIAGSDPSGGAGIQADLKTFSALGCYGTSAITALTVQNTQGVYRSVAVQADIVFEQITAILSDLSPAAVKIGMTANAAVTEAVAEALEKSPYRPPFIVVDPVIRSSSGLPLLDHTATQVLLKQLIPLCQLVTPNLPEAYWLTKEDTPHTAANKLIDQTGCQAVLIKGGHLDGNPVDHLYTRSENTPFYGTRVVTNNTHGTGCTLSSAIAAWSARGASLPQAIALAKQYVENALKSGANIHIGHGHGPANFFFNPSPAIIREK